MLERLGAVDWDQLTHAYGEAVDVPGLLRSLLAPTEEEREQAVYELFGNIWHQGTVYPATAAAVPFLYELLRNPAVPGRPAIAHLLSCIADGRGYLQIHAAGDDGERTWRKILGDEGKRLEDELEREGAVVSSVRRAVSEGLAALVPYIGDPEPEIRRSVAVALGNYPEHAALTLPALEAAAATEIDEEVQEALCESIERLK